MSNNNIKSDMGGGNPLNLIRVPSLNEVKNIIFSSDLNGSITIKNINTWQFNNIRTPWWIQNNDNKFAYASSLIDINLAHDDKTYIVNSDLGNPLCFHTVIEFRE